MNGKITIMAIATFVFLIALNSVSVAMAFPVGESNPEYMTIEDCTDLNADLQVLLENGIISSSDVRDVLLIFFCNDFGVF